jgi:hypothetical protein
MDKQHRIDNALHNFNVELLRILLDNNGCQTQELLSDTSQQFYESEIPITSNLSVWLNFGQDDKNLLSRH